MAVTFTDDELDLFNKNGISDDDIQATVNNYRSQGLDDNAIRQKVDVKLNALKGAVVTPELKGQNGEVVTEPSVDYGTKQARVKKNTWLHPVETIKKYFKASPEELDRIYKQKYQRLIDDRKKWEENHPMLSDFQKDLQPHYRSDLTDWELKAKYGLRPPAKEQLKTDVKKLGQDIIPSVGIATALLTDGASLTKNIGAKLTPFMGRKIAQSTASGLVGGGAGTGIAEVGRVLFDNESIPDAIKNTLIGTTTGGLLGLGGGRVGRYFAGKKLSNLPTATRADKRVVRKIGKQYYQDYIQDTSVKHKDLGKIDFDSVGVRENWKQKPKNMVNYQKLKENIKNAKYIGAEEKEHPIKSIKQIHRLRNGNEDYLIAETNNGKKFYISRDADLTKEAPEVFATEVPNSSGANNIVPQNTQKITSEEQKIIDNLINQELEHYHPINDKEAYNEILSAKKAIKNIDSGNYTTNDVDILNSFINEADSAGFTESEILRKKYSNLGIEDFETYMNRVENTNKPFVSEPPKTTIEGTGDVTNRGLSESVTNAKGTPQEVKQAIKSEMPQYRVLHNNELTEQAVQEVEANFNNELSRLSTSKDFDALDYEKARQLSKRLFDLGRNDEAINLIDNVSENATKKGQAIQALSLWSNMTPEGAVAKAQKLIKEANKKLPDKRKIKLSEEDIANIRNLQESALNTTDDLERSQGLARTAKYISELVPSNIGQKIKTYRNIALLLNPKTLGRNIVGNALFNTVDTGSKALATGIDRIIGLGTGQKTRVLPQLGDMLKGGVQGAKTGFKEALEGIDTRGLGQRFDLGSGRVFKNPIMRGLETGLDIGLRVPDRMQYEATFAESVANMMKAQGLKEPTQEILEQAEREALESVFQNNGVISDITLGLRNNVLNRLGGKDFGLGDVAVPYAQTPANLVQQGINYSPLGAIKGIYNLTQGNQRQASLDLARSLMGTGLIGTGYGLAQIGNMTPTQFEDSYYKNRDVKNNLMTLGIRPDSIGGVWYAPFQPVSTSLAIGSAIQQGENPTQAGLNTMLDLPFLQNTNRFISDVKDKGIIDAGVNFASSVPAQFVPTALGQVSQYLDNVQRETYDKNKFKQGINQAIAKTPLSQLLPEKINVKGEPIQRYNSEGIQRMFDTFLNPTFINKPINDTTMQELKVLYDITGNTKQFLPTVDKKIRFKQNGENKTIDLTGEQVSEYQQVLGRELYQNYTDLMNTEEYANSDDETRIKMLEKEKKRTKKYVDEGLFSELKNSYSD